MIFAPVMSKDVKFSRAKINNIKREQWLTEEQFNRREIQRKSARKRHDQKDKKKEWRLNNLDKEREYRKRSTNKRRNDPQFKILKSLHSRLYTAVKNQGAKKSARTLELADCTTKFLCNHLESQFTAGMTWDNMGRGGWHIDHIIPCAFFDLTKPSHQKVCFNWQNLQPLWEKDNCAKGDKIPLFVLLTILKYNYKTITL